MSGDIDAVSSSVTANPHFLLSDDNLQFSTSKPVDSIDEKSSRPSTHFDVLFNQSASTLSNQSMAAPANRPRIRSTNAQTGGSAELNAKPRSGPGELEKRQNPAINDIVPVLLQLITNGQANRSPGNNQALLNNQILPPGLLNNPHMKMLLNNNLLNNNLLNGRLPNRVNSRLPSQMPGGPLANNNLQNGLPNGFIVAPSGRPSLPLHFPPKQTNRPLINSGNLIPQQLNNQLLQHLMRPGAQFNLTSLNANLLNSLMASNQSLDQLLPSGVLPAASSSKSYTKVEHADVSKLLGVMNSKPARNEVVFSSTAIDDSINSIDSVHLNGLFARTSINRTINDLIPSSSPPNIRPSQTRPGETLRTSTQPDATVISNNHNTHNRPFNRTQLAGSFSAIPVTALAIDATTQLNTKQLLLDSESGAPSTTTIWQPFELFNTNSQPIKPTRSWPGNAPDIITKPEEASTFDITVRNKMGANESKIGSSSVRNQLSDPPTTVAAGLHEASAKEPEVVYGRRPANNAPHQELRPGSVNSVNPSTTQAIVTSVTLDHNQKATPSLPSSTNESVGRPLVYPVEMDLVKPQVAANPASSVSIITESGGGSVYIDAQQKHFKLKPAVQKTNTIPAMQIGSTMNVYGNNADDYNRKPGSSLSSSNPINPFSSLSNSLANSTNGDKPGSRTQVRRPTFRPKPATPLVRIDTCIVGDESTCGANLNEHCRTEGGISSCHCKPGYGRSTQRGLCIPTTSLAMSLKLDKLGDNKLQFSKNLLNADSEDYQYLEFESIQAINSLFQNSRMNKLFLGIRVNKFYPVQGKTMLNATIVLERNESTRLNSIKKQLQQELSRVISAKNNALGDSPLLVDSIALPRLDDINECSDPSLNDCSRNAKCINELGNLIWFFFGPVNRCPKQSPIPKLRIVIVSSLLLATFSTNLKTFSQTKGSFSCVCKPGFEDRYALASQMASSTAHSSSLTANGGNPASSHLSNSPQNKNLVMKLGRVCLGCSPAYCSNRGECSIQPNGEKLCKCRGK